MFFIRINMPRLCVHCGVHPIWSKGHCLYCQGFRDDPDYMKKKALRGHSFLLSSIKHSPIKKVSKSHQQEIVAQTKQDKAFYALCNVSLPHVCTYCDKPLGELTSGNFHHCFEKSLYPHLRYEVADIAVTCLMPCHAELTAHNYNAKMKQVMEQYAERLISMGLLEQIGEPDYYNPRNWVIKPLRP